MSSESFEVFYDGDCPLCVREIKTLRKLDRKDRIVFTDIAEQGFDARVTGLSQGELMASIRGRMPDGTLVEGVEVFRQLYSAVGLKPLIPLSRLPGIRQGLDAGYKVFARNRLRLTGRCTEESCEVPGAPAAESS
ncbi:MAG: putative DCC family thiol-disulfide oxidoreductase YuxK [Cognaticolwellia sp.]|jgi:predicted DCC family thiol-disulfide oxidoreductase YuxK